MHPLLPLSLLASVVLVMAGCDLLAPSRAPKSYPVTVPEPTPDPPGRWEPVPTAIHYMVGPRSARPGEPLTFFAVVQRAQNSCDRPGGMLAILDEASRTVTLRAWREGWSGPEFAPCSPMRSGGPATASLSIPGTGSYRVWMERYLPLSSMATEGERVASYDLEIVGF